MVLELLQNPLALLHILRDLVVLLQGLLADRLLHHQLEAQGGLAFKQLLRHLPVSQALI